LKSKIGAVIVAAGQGMITPGVSKLVEPADERRTSLLGLVARTVYEAGIFTIVYVVSPRFAEQHWQTLKRDAPHVLLIGQPAWQEERRGAADAVRCCLSALEASGCTDFLVIFADMPLWRSATLQRLVELHQRERPAISLVSVPSDGARTPQRILERYGRIFRDASGRITRIIEPGDLTEADCREVRTVNPSLYVFQRNFFALHSLLLPVRDKGDGYPPEKHLPPIVALAYQLGHCVSELPLEDPTEALGVNTAAELAEVRQIIRVRERAESGVQRANSAAE
jgi:bifunctional N-acetylglucosamine-1-phosphate-uridyltransferase/glucosamine-1-phosphate-acetyltransferase GlmU-like protein